jgi:hypothetical protein
MGGMAPRTNFKRDLLSFKRDLLSSKRDPLSLKKKKKRSLSSRPSVAVAAFLAVLLCRGVGVGVWGRGLASPLDTDRGGAGVYYCYYMPLPSITLLKKYLLIYFILYFF